MAKGEIKFQTQTCIVSKSHAYLYWICMILSSSGKLVPHINYLYHVSSSCVHCTYNNHLLRDCYSRLLETPQDTVFSSSGFFFFFFFTKLKIVLNIIMVPYTVYSTMFYFVYWSAANIPRHLVMSTQNTRPLFLPPQASISHGAVQLLCTHFFSLSCSSVTPSSFFSFLALIFFGLMSKNILHLR